MNEDKAKSWEDNFMRMRAIICIILFLVVAGLATFIPGVDPGPYSMLLGAAFGLAFCLGVFAVA